MPMLFQRKPRAWHSSSAVMISSQPGECVLVRAIVGRGVLVVWRALVVLGVKVWVHDSCLMRIREVV